jgi:hypothetical protein
MDEELSPENIALMLLAGWETSVNIVDSLMMIVRDLPDWNKRFTYYQNDPDRIQYTKTRFDPARRAFEAILRGEASVQLLQQALAVIEKPPN